MFSCPYNDIIEFDYGGEFVQKLIVFLKEFLRINAIKRLGQSANIMKKEAGCLVFFTFLFAIFEGVGISFLLPVLQYAEDGSSAIDPSSGGVWGLVARVFQFVHIPINLITLLCLAFSPILMRQVVFYLKTWYSAIVSGRVTIRSRMKVVRDIYSADYSFFLAHSVGQVVNVVIGLSTAGGTALLAIINYFSILLLIVLYVLISLAISVPLTICATFFAVTVLLLVKSNISAIGRYGAIVAKRSQEMMGKIVERMSLSALVKLRNQKEQEILYIDDYSQEMYRIGVKQAKLSARVEVISDPLLMLSAFITLYFGISILGMTLAQLGILMFILIRINAKVKELNAARQAITSAMANVNLLNEMVNEAQNDSKIISGSQAFNGLKKSLVFDHVYFAYSDVKNSFGEIISKGGSVLKDINLEITAGSFIALAGRSGAGKSTMVNLLPRLQDVTSGAIYFDSINIKDLRLEDLRPSIGFLRQTAMLFNESIYDNLVYGLGFIPEDEQIRKALDDAFASFVYDLPDGLDTKLGDSGVRFSGGEKQRIALARVLLEDTDILVLDEPTSALDSESEAYIQEALSRLHGKKTIIVIAHRLATIMQADTIFVMQNGSIVERGSHSELLNAQGVYSVLFKNQINGMIGM